MAQPNDDSDTNGTMGVPYKWWTISHAVCMLFGSAIYFLPAANNQLFYKEICDRMSSPKWANISQPRERVFSFSIALLS
jgi:hypothetical protein